MALSQLAGWTRDKATFACGASLLRAWDVPENYIARCFVTFGYCDGEYPRPKPRKDNHRKIIG